MKGLGRIRLQSLAATVAVIIGGLLLACAFPLPSILKALEGPSAAWGALVPLIIVARISSRRAAFAYGWLGGMAFWLLSLVWLLQLRFTWGNLWLVMLAWGFLSAWCSLFFALFSALTATFFPWPAVDHHPALPVKCRFREFIMLGALPVFWIGMEWIRGAGASGFPWNALGISQARNIGLLQLASVGGVYAVSALVVLVNVALASTVLSFAAPYLRKGCRRRFHPELLLALTSCILAWGWGDGERKRVLHDADGLVMQVASVQPGIPQPQKWEAGTADAIYHELESRSMLALSVQPDLIIWPETAIPEVYRYAPVAQALVHNIVTNGVPLLFGTMDMIESEGVREWYNSALLVGIDGTVMDHYHKRHLVPFGEYLPFENVIPELSRLAPLGFSCIPGDRAHVFELLLHERNNRPAAALPFGVLICFEDIMPRLSRELSANGASLLINLTNDGWFDGSSAAEQHMLHAVFRTVETRRPMIRSTNTGITCLINHAGQIVVQSELLASGFLTSGLWIPAAPQESLYMRGGYRAAGVAALLTVLACLVMFFRTRLQRFRLSTVPVEQSGGNVDS